MSLRALPVALLALGCVGPGPLAPLAPDARAELQLAAARPAWGQVAALELRGQVTQGGREEAFITTLLPDGRFRREVAGPLGKVEVFDGERAFRRDRSGLTRELHFGERDEAPLLAALRTGTWLEDPGLELLTEPDGRLRVRRPGGPLDFAVRLDQGTRRVQVVSDGSEADGSTSTLSDWRQVDGIPVAFDLVTETAGGEVVRYRVDSARSLDQLPADLLEPPAPAPSDVTFAGAPDVEVARSRTGHLFVRPRLEGRDVGWFLLDSGAGAMVVDDDVADALGLETVGRVLAVGVAGREPTRFVAAERLELGPLDWHGLVLLDLDLAFVSDLLGVEVAGIVGYDLFGRAVLDLEPGPRPSSPGDLDGDGSPDPAPPLAGGGRLGLHAPGAWSPPAGTTFSALAFEGSSPCVLGRFPTLAGPVERWFRLDTGANGSVTFHAPAVDRHRLLANRDTTLARFGGVGGSGGGFFGELEWFELAGRRFEAFECGFATTEIGTFADPYTAGNIGQGLLEPFRIVFDYPQARIALLSR
jgi:hypothetical protein